MSSGAVLNGKNVIEPVGSVAVSHHGRVTTTDNVTACFCLGYNALFLCQSRQGIVVGAVDPTCAQVERHAQTTVCPYPATDPVARLPDCDLISLRHQSTRGRKTAHSGTDYPNFSGSRFENGFGGDDPGLVGRVSGAVV